MIWQSLLVVRVRPAATKSIHAAAPSTLRRLPSSLLTTVRCVSCPRGMLSALEALKTVHVIDRKIRPTQQMFHPKEPEETYGEAGSLIWGKPE